MEKIIKTVAFAILVCSCNSSSQSNSSEVSAVESQTVQPVNHEVPIQDEGYVYEVVTSDLISDLGGYKALKDYQFYLSDSFTLTRHDNEKNSTGDGNVNSVSGQYRIYFNEETPGVYKDDYIGGLEIYFGEEDDEFLSFELYNQTYCLDNESWYGTKVYYKGEYWDIDVISDINLLVRIEQQSFEQEEVAKGRLLR